MNQPDRRQRLAEALRANLKKRKEQQRSRSEKAKTGDTAPVTPSQLAGGKREVTGDD